TRVAAPFVEGAWGHLFLAGWTMVAFVLFPAGIPAASHFHTRLTLIVLVPSLLLGAVLAAALARAAMPRQSAALAAALLVTILAVNGKARFWWPVVPDGTPAIYRVIERLDALGIAPGTPLYADSGASLVLRFYSSLPFRSIM